MTNRYWDSERIVFTDGPNGPQSVVFQKHVPFSFIRIVYCGRSCIFDMGHISTQTLWVVRAGATGVIRLPFETTEINIIPFGLDKGVLGSFYGAQLEFWVARIPIEDSLRDHGPLLGDLQRDNLDFGTDPFILTLPYDTPVRIAAMAGYRDDGFGDKSYRPLKLSTAGNLLTESTISGAVDTELPAASAAADGAANPTAPSVKSHDMLFNETTWDRQRPNTVETVRLVTSLSADTTIAMTNRNARGVALVIYVSIASGGATVTVTIRGKSAVGTGQTYDILQSLALGAAGVTVLEVYPGLLAAANAKANDILPRTWEVFFDRNVGGTIDIGAEALYVL